MGNELATMLKEWHVATGELPWGVQRNFLETLKLAEEEEIHIAFGADFSSDGSPCLVNANAHSLAALGGTTAPGAPSSTFREVVRLFDKINYKVRELSGVEGNLVTHFGANVLVRNFGPLKTVAEASKAAQEEDAADQADLPYKERSDSELMNDWIASLSTPTDEEMANVANQSDSVRHSG